MKRMNRVIVTTVGLVVGALLLTGCAAVQQFLAEVPLDQVLPSAVPSVPASAEPLEKTYTGGSRPEGLTDAEWQKKAQRRILAAAAIDRVLVYSVSADGSSDTITVIIKGDPADAELLATIESGVVPVALRWAPTVTIEVDPSICGVVSEFRDSKICDKLGNR